MQLIENRSQTECTNNFDHVRLKLAQLAGQPGGLSIQNAHDLAQKTKLGFEFNVNQQIIKIDFLNDFK